MNLPAAIVADGAILAVHTHPQAFTGPDGIKHPASAWQHWTDEDWSEKCPGWLVLPVTDEPPELQAGQTSTRDPFTEWTIGSDAVSVTYTVAERPPADVRAERKEEVRRIRKEREAAGITFYGVPIRTDPESQGKIGDAITGLRAAPEGTTIDWEGQPDIWVTVDLATLENIGKAVFAYVQGCFSHSRALLAALDEATGETEAEENAALLAVDITAGWPGQVVE